MFFSLRCVCVRVQVCFQLGKGAPVTYALEGSVAVAGRAVQWLRDNLQLISSAPEIEALASSVES